MIWQGMLVDFRNGCRTFFSCGAMLLLVCGLNMSVVEATEYFVAVDHPNASDSNDGLSLDQPFRTLGRAVMPLLPGDTLSIKEGIYREGLVVTRAGTPSGQIVIRAFPGDEGRVVIRGSDVVTGWTNDGGDVWSISWQPLPPIVYGGGWLDYGEYSRRREMVFVEGNPLEQVLLEADLVSGRFWMDDNAQRIRIHCPENPNVSQVEIAVRTQGISAQESYNVFRGLRVEHVSTDLFTAAMHLGYNQRVEDCRVEHNNGNGIIAYADSVIMGSTSSHNGRVGIVLGESNSVLEANETNHNSWRYGPRWHAGGIKILGSMPSNNRIVGHTSKYNNGRGIWFDTVGPGNIVEASHLEGNVVAGLQFEAAIGPNLVINNVILETTRDPNGGDPPDNGAGIVLYEAMDTWIYNNTIVDVSGSGIVITGGERDGVYSVNTEFFNNIVVGSAEKSALRIAVRDRSREEPNVASHHFDNNLYFGNLHTIVFPKLTTLHGLEFWSLQEWQAIRGEDLNSMEESPMFANQAGRDYTVQTSSLAIDAGLDLAAVIDDFAGTPRPQDNGYDIGAYECPLAGGCGSLIFGSSFESGDLSDWEPML